jgi:hypothetical protein
MATNAKGERGCPEKDRAGLRQHCICEIKYLQNWESLSDRVKLSSMMEKRFAPLSKKTSSFWECQGDSGRISSPGKRNLSRDEAGIG